MRLTKQALRHQGGIPLTFLRVKKVQGHGDVFEGSITMDYRLLFQITSKGYVLLRIREHDLLGKA
jgi:hypothetical protein